MAAEELNAVYDSMRSGLFIVTSIYRKRPAGCTCLWVSRVSFNPPLVGLYLAPSRFTCETISRGKRFALHALAEDNLDLARRFGLLSSRDADKFADTPWQAGRNGVPLLSEALSVLECRLVQEEDKGDHRLLLGEVLGGAVQRPGVQLLYDPQTFYLAGEQRRELQLGAGMA